MHTSNGMEMRTYRRQSPRGKVLALVLAMFATNSCTPGPLPGPEPTPVDVSASLVDTLDPHAAFGHTLTPQARALCLAHAWTTCTIPEFTDDQSFMDTPRTYGPHAYVVPSQELRVWTSDTDFLTGRLVGFVGVAPGRLPATYTDLRLQNGITCMYLRYQSGAFTAFMAPLAAIPCPTSIPSTAQSLAVKAAAMPAGFSNPDDLPPVARFHEGKKGNSVGHIAIGFRCGTKWCRIMPLSTAGASDTLPLKHKADKPTVRTWAIHGWHDVQTLGLPPTTSPGALVRSTTEASVIPEPMLRTYNTAGWPTGFAHVATVRVWKRPEGKYETDWKFKKGFNEIWLKKISATSWEAELRQWVDVGGTPTLVFVRTLHARRIPHGQWVPSTARFLWSAGDEDLWVACDDGCCKISTSPG